MFLPLLFDNDNLPKGTRNQPPEASMSFIVKQRPAFPSSCAQIHAAVDHKLSWVQKNHRHCQPVTFEQSRRLRKKNRFGLFGELFSFCKNHCFWLIPSDSSVECVPGLLVFIRTMFALILRVCPDRDLFLLLLSIAKQISSPAIWTIRFLERQASSCRTLSPNPLAVTLIQLITLSCSVAGNFCSLGWLERGHRVSRNSPVFGMAFPSDALWGCPLPLPQTTWGDLVDHPQQFH